MRLCKKCKKDISNKRPQAIYCSRTCKNLDKVGKYYNKEKMKDYYNKIKEKRKKYKEENKDKIKEYHRIYNKSYNFSEYNKRRREDPIYKLKQNIRNLIKNAFLRKFTLKSKKTLEILGCDYDYFVIYLSSLFTDEMTWENYGEIWEIDHIIPISSAINEKEILELNNYKNLRPLLKVDNRKKGKKIL